VTGSQPDVTVFTISLQARPVSQLLTHRIMDLSTCALDIFSGRTLWERVLKALLKSKAAVSTGFLWSTGWVTLS